MILWRLNDGGAGMLVFDEAIVIFGDMKCVFMRVRETKRAEREFKG